MSTVMIFFLELFLVSQRIVFQNLFGQNFLKGEMHFFLMSQTPETRLDADFHNKA